MEKKTERIYQLLFDIEELCSTKQRKTIQGNFDSIERKVFQIYNILGALIPEVRIKTMIRKASRKKNNELS